MHDIIIDGRKMLDKETAHTYLKEILHLPEYYGRNLDALYDCLTEISECRISFTYMKELQSNLQRYSHGLLHVFEAAAEHNPKLSVVLEDIVEE